VRFAPFLDVIEAALVEAPPFRVQFQALRPIGPLHNLIGALFQSPLIVLKREIESVALDRLCLAKDKAISGDGRTYIEREP
jgi:hypothetical protein